MLPGAYPVALTDFAFSFLPFLSLLLPISCWAPSLDIPNTLANFFFEVRLKSETDLLNRSLNWKINFIYYVTHELRSFTLNDILEKTVVQCFACKNLEGDM